MDWQNQQNKISSCLAEHCFGLLLFLGVFTTMSLKIMTGIITTPQCQKERSWLQSCSLCIFISSWNLWSRQFKTSLQSELLLSLTLWLHNLMPVDIWVFRDDFICSPKTVLECIKCSCIISCPINQWALWHSELCQTLCWNTHSGTAVDHQFSDGLEYGSCDIVGSIFENFYEYSHFVCFKEGKICNCF